MIHARRVSVTHTVVDKLRYKRNHGCPASDKEQRQHHFWCNTAVDAEEDRPFRMVVEVARIEPLEQVRLVSSGTEAAMRGPT